MEKTVVIYDAKECEHHDGITCKYDGKVTSMRKCAHCQELFNTHFKSKDKRW